MLLTKEFLASSFEEHAQVLTAETRLDGWFLHFLAPRMAALVRLGGHAPHVGISRKPGPAKVADFEQCDFSGRKPSG